MADKIVMVTIKILSLNKNVEFHEKYTIDNVAVWRKNERLVVLGHYLHVPKHTHTHPNTDLNAHIWKYQYIYFFQTSNCIQRNRRDTHNNNYPLLFTEEAKSQKVLFKKSSLTFSKLYPLSFQQEQ